MNRDKISRSAGGIGSAILGSRILGFARDVLMAKYFGTGMTAQAFFAAFRIPNLMRRLFGEGALSAGFIPVFTDEMQKNGRESAWALAVAVVNLLAGILIVIVAAGMIFAPQITRVVVPGFRDMAGQFELTASLLRIMFPYLLFVCLAALMMGVLNSLKHFAAPAAAPMLLNLSLILYLVLFSRSTANPAAGLGAAVLIGGAAQLALQAAVAVKKGLPLGSSFYLYHPKVKRIALLMLPAAGGLAVYQMNILVDSICASYETIAGRGSIAALWYAERVMQFPLAIFGIATATAVFPALSQSVSEKNFLQFERGVEFGLKRVFFLTLPSAAGLIVLRESVIAVLFERNEFGSYSVMITSAALMYYCAGLFAYAGVHILSRGFYAMQDTKTPVKTAAIAMFLNAGLNLILMHPLKVGGIALATSLSAAVNFLLLFRKLSGLRPGIDKAGIGRSFTRSLFVSIIMAVLLAFMLMRMPPAGSVAAGIIGLLSVIAAGAGFYFGAAWILGFEEWKILKASLKKSRANE
jgi:putative peptidoglycan lipid II flippase